MFLPAAPWIPGERKVQILRDKAEAVLKLAHTGGCLDTLCPDAGSPSHPIPEHSAGCLYLIHLLELCVYVCDYCAHEFGCSRPGEAMRSLGAQVTGCCELPDVAGGN